MVPHDGLLRLTLASMAFGAWFMLTACALLVWRFVVGPPPQVLVEVVIGMGMLAGAGIMVSAASCCAPSPKTPPSGATTSRSRLAGD